MKIKITLVALMWMAYFGFESYIYPLMSNNIAVNQLEDSASSFVAVQGWNSFNAWLPIILIIITIWSIFGRVKNIVKNLKNTKGDK